LFNERNKLTWRNLPAIDISHCGTEPWKFTIIKAYWEKVRADLIESARLCTLPFVLRPRLANVMLRYENYGKPSAFSVYLVEKGV